LAATVFAQSDVPATIYFITQFSAALFESDVYISAIGKIFRKCKCFEKED